MLKLRLLNGPREGRQFRVSDTKPVSVGRSTGRLRLHDSRVSKRHAEICFEDGVWVIRDVGSSNGTYVNHERAEGEVALETGDLLQLGRVLVKVLRADEIGMDVTPGDGLDEAAGAGVEQAGSADDWDAGTFADDSDDAGIDDDDLALLLGGGETPAGAWEGPDANRFQSDEDADLISLAEDGAEGGSGEQAHRPARLGTTAISAITDAGEGSGQSDLEQGDDSIDNDQAEQADPDDAFDDTPEVVGLSLSHRPPQQPTVPEPKQEQEQEQEPAAPDAEAGAAVSDAEAGENQVSETGESGPSPSDGASAGDGGFDIDAAFDALAAGLEDEPEPDSPPQAHPDTSPEVSDGLVDSQLDVGFIQDALAKLKDKASQPDADGPAAPDPDEQAPDRG